MALKTYGGEFRVAKRSKKGTMGMSIELAFDPGPPVVAEKIAMTQTARSEVGGAPNYGDYDSQIRSNGEAVPGVLQEPGYHDDRDTELQRGTHIDRGNSTNPIYGTKDLASPTTDSTATSEYLANAAPGKRVPDDSSESGFDTEPAILRDGPELDHPSQPFSQKFETTALVLSGDMAGTYLGSVKWGYDRKMVQEGTSSAPPVWEVTLDDVTLASKGVPTATWMQAAKRWNTTRVGTEEVDPEDDWEETMIPVAKGSRTPLPLSDVHTLTPEQALKRLTLAESFLESGGGSDADRLKVQTEIDVLRQKASELEH